nr:hypothetical protein [Tanacetum cinerariifolium]
SLVDTIGLGSYLPLPTQGTQMARNTPGKSLYANVTVDSENATKDVVSPFVVNETMRKEKQSSLVDTIGLGSYLPLPTQGTPMARNTPSKSLYANVTDNNVVAMSKITMEYYTCNIHVEYEWKRPRCAYCMVFGHVQEECPMNIGAGESKNLKKSSQTPKGIPIGQKMGFKPTQYLYQPVSKNPTTNTSKNKKNNVEPTKVVSNSNPFEVFNSVENDVELGTNGGTSNLGSEEANSSGSLFWNVDSKCAYCMVFGHVQEECPMNIGAGESKNLKKSSQTPKGIPIGQKMGFKPTQYLYQPVSKNPTTNTSKNKKNNVEPTKVVSNSNPFEVFNSVENDVELGTNGGTSNLASEEANSSGSLFWNVDSKLFLGDYDSEDEVASVDNEMASFLAKKDGYGTHSFLEKWKESYKNDDYDYDPYDDDMYEGHEIPDKLQVVCDNLDIIVRCRRKK